MSDGPIKRERASHLPVKVSTPDAYRVCARGGRDPEPGRAYCGRRHKKPDLFAAAWRRVTCTDCRAAYRSDGGRIELMPDGRRSW